jgi:hypothetical protein
VSLAVIALCASVDDRRRAFSAAPRRSSDEVYLLDDCNVLDSTQCQALIGIGGTSRRRPSPTTGHTGPYHGGSIRLSLSDNIESRKADRVKVVVSQCLLNRRMS